LQKKNVLIKTIQSSQNKDWDRITENWMNSQASISVQSLVMLLWTTTQLLVSYIWNSSKKKSVYFSRPL